VCHQFDDTLQVTQNVDFDSDLNVDGNAQIDGTLTVDTTSLLKDNVVLRGGSKTLKLQNGSGTDKVTLHSTSGNAEITGTATLGALGVTNNTTIGGTLGVTGQITGNVTGALTGNADTASLVDVTETAATNLDFFPTFVSATSGNTEIRTDSTNLRYNPSANRLTVTNFRSTTDFEVQGNLTLTGAITYGQAQVGSIANHDTDALTEGSSNLYFTNERVDDRVNALITGGTGITATYDDAGNILTLSASS
jgi:cytoskeletal protein CcmA (bactofilin family)